MNETSSIGKQNVAEGILKNAVDSISLGIEDYQLGIGDCESSDPRRLVSCTRNLFAGIILLFKHKLAKLSSPGSDEVLIKQRILPIRNSEGGIEWQGQGKNTVDVQRIRERFDNLNVLVEWKRIEAINKYRNNIEHYYSSEPHDSIRSLITDCFVVIRYFVREHLKMYPLDLFGTDIWNVLTEVAEVYEKEKQECVKHIKSIGCEHDTLEAALTEYRCGECKSGLIDVTSQETDIFDTKFKCLSCGKIWDFVSIVDQAVPEYFSTQNYLSVKDGGYPATIPCPICDTETYVLEEDKCLVCGEVVNWECERCGQSIPPEEMDGGGLCSYCNHIMSKDD